MAFEIGERVGAGSFGEVYTGTYKGEQVAIRKLILENVSSDADDMDEMLELDHPNVLKLFHWEDRDEFRFMVMELYDATLRDFLSEKYQGAMPSDVKVLQQLAAGVQHIHLNNLVHRDIKPDNVLIKSTGTVPIVKISNLSLQIKGPSNVNMKIAYTAPELIDFADNEDKLYAKASDSSDVFALGCTFFEFLTRGTHPFGDESNFASRIKSGVYDLSKLPANHFALKLIRQMIRRSPDQRPSASDICKRLDIKDTPEVSTPTSPISPKGWPSITKLAGLKQNETAVFQLLPENKLGNGKFATVYKEIYNGRPVAVKRIELERCQNDAEFIEEQSVMKQLHHPNVLCLIDFIDKGEFRYLILELCDGTLDDFVQGKMSRFDIQPNELDWMHQMSRGVEHIHTKKLVHRDIKPHNILISITNEGVVMKISDFGFCKPTTDRGSFSQSSGVKGTLDYMAPEVLTSASGTRVTLASDIFSLGCVFFNLVVRRSHPYGESFFIVPNIITGNPVNIGLAASYKAYDLIKRMILSNAEARPPITEVVVELRRLDSTN